MSPDKLVYMANQIGRFFASQGDDKAAVPLIADHLVKFWDPRMRKARSSRISPQGGGGLDPLRSARPSRRSQPKPPAGSGGVGLLAAP